MVYIWIIVSKKKMPQQTILVVNLTALNFNDILTIVLLDSILVETRLLTGGIYLIIQNSYLLSFED